MSTPFASLDVERRLLGERGHLIAGMDEVGRGSVFGPVGVGVVVTDGVGEPPDVRDSKLLSAPVREGLVAAIHEWATSYGVGYASAGEIDAYGINAALRIAGRRAMAQLSVRPDWVILDGTFDWLGDQRAVLGEPLEYDMRGIRVVTMTKADQKCASVASASVLAKVERDQLVVEMAKEYPGYGIESHKGYGTRAHLDAIAQLGASEQHRRSWNLSGKK